MKRLSKYILSLMLIFAMVMSVSGLTAFAEPDYYTPTPDEERQKDWYKNWSGFTTDSHGLMSFKTGDDYNSEDIGYTNGYTVRGNIGGVWRPATYYDGPYYPYILGQYAESVEIESCTPNFISDGKEIDLVYTVKNKGSNPQTYSFNIWADSMIDADDGSKNSINTDRSVLTMTSDTNIIFYARSTTPGAKFKCADYEDSHDGTSDAFKDPSTYDEVLEPEEDSAFFAYWPQHTLTAGESTEYHFIVGMRDANQPEAVEAPANNTVAPAATPVLSPKTGDASDFRWMLLVVMIASLGVLVQITRTESKNNR